MKELLYRINVKVLIRDKNDDILQKTYRINYKLPTNKG